MSDKTLFVQAGLEKPDLIGIPSKNSQTQKSDAAGNPFFQILLGLIPPPVCMQPSLPSMASGDQLNGEQPEPEAGTLTSVDEHGTGPRFARIALPSEKPSAENVATSIAPGTDEPEGSPAPPRAPEQNPSPAAEKKSAGEGLPLQKVSPAEIGTDSFIQHGSNPASGERDGFPIEVLRAVGLLPHGTKNDDPAGIAAAKSGIETSAASQIFGKNAPHNEQDQTPQLPDRGPGANAPLPNSGHDATRPTPSTVPSALGKPDATGSRATGNLKEISALPASATTADGRAPDPGSLLEKAVAVSTLEIPPPAEQVHRPPSEGNQREETRDANGGNLQMRSTSVLPRGASVNPPQPDRELPDAFTGRETSTGLHSAGQSLRSGSASTEAPATTTPAHAVPLPPAFASNVVNQVVKNLILQLDGKTSEMRITLKPEVLGEVGLKVRMEDGKMQAQFDVGQASVKAAIESSLPDLRQALLARGIDVQRIDVFASPHSSFRESAGGQDERGYKRSTRKMLDVERTDEETGMRDLGYNTMEAVV